MSEQVKTPQSNGYEYDCESYAGTDEAAIDKMFPGWRETAKAEDGSKEQAQAA